MTCKESIGSKACPFLFRLCFFILRGFCSDNIRCTVAANSFSNRRHHALFDFSLRVGYRPMRAEKSKHGACFSVSPCLLEIRGGASRKAGLLTVRDIKALQFCGRSKLSADLSNFDSRVAYVQAAVVQFMIQASLSLQSSSSAFPVFAFASFCPGESLQRIVLKDDFLLFLNWFLGERLSSAASNTHRHTTVRS